MHQFRSAAMRTVVFALLPCVGTVPAESQPLCKPAILSKSARSSEVLNQEHRWTAVFAVDASRCATNSGTFDIDFVREKEYGPDLTFKQRFIWRPGQTEIAMDLWWDERIRDYRVGEITACPCRD